MLLTHSTAAPASLLCCNAGTATVEKKKNPPDPVSLTHTHPSSTARAAPDVLFRAPGADCDRQGCGGGGGVGGGGERTAGGGTGCAG